MIETPRRLTPTNETLRELYLKSGNECAFPECHRRIINEDGVFIGEICHIEAALPGGERFNPNLTNEERRRFENLMLMCHEHHKVTDDMSVYTVKRLQEMKATHEAKFTNIVEKIRASIVDQTKLSEVAPAASLGRINEVLAWNNSPEELLETAKEVADFAARLRKLPLRTKELVTVIVERGRPGGYLDSDWRVLFDDIVEATGESESEILNTSEF